MGNVDLIARQKSGRCMIGSGWGRGNDSILCSFCFSLLHLIDFVGGKMIGEETNGWIDEVVQWWLNVATTKYCVSLKKKKKIFWENCLIWGWSQRWIHCGWDFGPKVDSAITNIVFRPPQLGEIAWTTMLQKSELASRNLLLYNVLDKPDALEETIVPSTFSIVSVYIV